MKKSMFTVEEANALLPFLTNELKLLQDLKEQFDTACTNLQQLKQLSLFNGNQPNNDPFFKMECTIDFLQLQIGLHIDNIMNTGAQLKDIELGLIDFPTIINEKKVLLCWRLGENEIAFYHSESEGYPGRKPLT